MPVFNCLIIPRSRLKILGLANEMYKKIDEIPKIRLRHAI
jgi:hypothetical protein